MAPASHNMAASGESDYPQGASAAFPWAKAELLVLLEARPRAGTASLSLDPIGQTSQASPELGRELEPTAQWEEC